MARGMTDAELRPLIAWIAATTGMQINADQEEWLEARVAKHVARSGSARALLDDLARDSGVETALVDSLCVHETRFFREPQQFDYLETHVFPMWSDELRRQKDLRIWSAACSTGEEPFSLAMLLAKRFPPEAGYDGRVFATDISTRALARAAQATWPIQRAAEIPAELLRSFMLRGTGPCANSIRATPGLRDRVHFARLNLNFPNYGIFQKFHAIFCRNVLIYFTREARERVLNNLLNVLRPGGFLFVGHADSLFGMSDRVRNVAPNIYQLQDGQGRE